MAAGRRPPIVFSSSALFPEELSAPSVVGVKAEVKWNKTRGANCDTKWSYLSV